MKNVLPLSPQLEVDSCVSDIGNTEILICGPKANNSGECLILCVTVFFIGEQWFSLLTLLSIGLSNQFCFEMLLKIGTFK